MTISKQQVKDSLVIIGFVAISLYLVYLNSCNPTAPVQVNTTESDSLKIANRDLKEIIEGLDVVISEQEQEIAKKKTTYIAGKERIKYLIDKDTLTVHDTLVIEMTAQLDRADSIINLQGAQIDTLQFKITKLDKIISNDSLILSLSEAENKALTATIKKQNRKIKGLKITAISAPIATILLFLAVK